MTRPRWPDEKLDQLRALVADARKLSAAQIGEMLHVKRNAVIGACFRNGIKLQGKPSGERRLPKGARKLPKGMFAKVPKAFCKKEKLPEVRLSDVIPLNLTLDDLATGQCRYPLGDGPFLFCGHPQQADSSYCPAHEKLCHSKPLELTDEERQRRRLLVKRIWVPQRGRAA